jgi:hypothetical protein
MPHLQFTQVETRLASERHLKYQGTAKVGLDEITFHPTSTTKVDEAKLERLRRIFRKEGCRRLDVRNHATAVVSKTHLDRALSGGGGGGDVIYPDPSLESDMQATTTISLPSCLYCTSSHFLRANFKPRLGACVGHSPSVLFLRIPRSAATKPSRCLCKIQYSLHMAGFPISS